MSMSNPLTPYVGILVVYLRAEFSFSLKDRRRIVRSLLERIRRKWDVSAVDMGPDNERTDVVLAFTAAGPVFPQVSDRLEAVFSFILQEEGFGNFEIENSWREIGQWDALSSFSTPRHGAAEQEVN